MDAMRILWSRCVALLRRRRLDESLDEELRTHIDLAAEENERRGIPADEARRQAFIQFGGVTQIKERYRVRRGVPFLEEAGRDLRFGIRGLRRSPGFALTAILTLALGIGAVTSVFSVVDAVLLKPFAFRDPGRLVVMREVEEELSRQMSAVPDNYRHYLRLKRDSKSIEDAAIFFQPVASVSATGDRPRIVGAVLDSPNLFRVLGVQPMLGRDFLECDAQKGAPHVALITYGAWQTFFAGDPKAVGQNLQIDGNPATVIGVLPPAMLLPRIAMAPNIASGPQLETMVYEPLAPSDLDLRNDTGNFNYRVIARLKDGVTVEQASAEMETLQRAYTLSAHLPMHLGISLTPLAKDVTANISGALWLMFAAVVGVLLIACVNLANLQLARAVSSERETAVRAALGAGKGSLIMARFAECLVLAIAGGIAGVAFAVAGVRLFIALVPANVPRLNEVHLSLPVLCLPPALRLRRHFLSVFCLCSAHCELTLKRLCRRILRAQSIPRRAAAFVACWLRHRWPAP
jgi:predicted permease